MAAAYGDHGNAEYARTYAQNLPDYYRYSHGGNGRPYSSGGVYASGGYDQIQTPYYASGGNPSYSSLRSDVRSARSHRSRPRSVPPDPARRRSRRRRRHRSPPDSDEDDAPGNEDPVRKAHGLLKKNFSKSSAGVGVAVLGAVLGGLVAREVGSASNSNHGRRRSHHDTERSRLISTVVGAAVGGFGANALEKRIETNRDKTAEKEDAWEKKWHRDARGRNVERDYDGDDESRGGRRSARRSRDPHAR